MQFVSFELEFLQIFFYITRYLIICNRMNGRTKSSVRLKNNQKYRMMEKRQGVMNVVASKEAIRISKG